jgi:NADH:ubiquinone oxidoreductase subunit 2 (subunit N)
MIAHLLFYFEKSEEQEEFYILIVFAVLDPQCLASNHFVSTIASVLSISLYSMIRYFRKHTGMKLRSNIVLGDVIGRDDLAWR